MFKSSGSNAEENGLSKQRHAEINIFTVASGLLYEVRSNAQTDSQSPTTHVVFFQRFASIMILSVLRNTKHTVKFWFIENFLSPSFLVRSDSPIHCLMERAA